VPPASWRCDCGASLARGWCHFNTCRQTTFMTCLVQKVTRYDHGYRTTDKGALGVWRYVHPELSCRYARKPFRRQSHNHHESDTWTIHFPLVQGSKVAPHANATIRMARPENNGLSRSFLWRGSSPLVAIQLIDRPLQTQSLACIGA
jgi:hypothetical protein